MFSANNGHMVQEVYHDRLDDISIFVEAWQMAKPRRAASLS